MTFRKYYNAPTTILAKIVAFLQLSKLETLSLPAGLNYAPVIYTVVFLLPSRMKQVTPQNELAIKLQPVPEMGS